jgi:type I restriction enzyme S subunit
LKDRRVYEVQEKISKEGLENSFAKYVTEDDLLVAMYGATAGKVGLAKSRFTINQAICAIKPNERFFSGFYFYYFIFIREKLLSQRYGGAQPNISQQTIKNLIVPVPSIHEQKQIALVLTKIQNAKESSEIVLVSLKELKKSLMKHLFTYGAEGLEDSARLKLKETEIGQISVDWKLVDLSEIAELILGQSPKGDTYNNSGEGIPLINGPTEYGLKYPRTIQWTTSPTKLCKKDDILFCVRGNTLGRLNIAQGAYCLGRGVAAIRGIHNRSETSYVYYFLEFRAKTIYNSCAGQNSTFPNISGATLKKLKIGKPPVFIQRQIASILQTIDQEIFSVIKERNSLEELFKSLLSDLMSAKIRVHNLEF